MRYMAEIDYDTISAYALEECASAKVRPSVWTKSPALALRHARAMAACYGALKRWAREQRRVPTDWTALEKADVRLQAVTARLVAVEKEVSRG